MRYYADGIFKKTKERFLFVSDLYHLRLSVRVKRILRIDKLLCKEKLSWRNVEWIGRNKIVYRRDNFRRSPNILSCYECRWRRNIKCSCSLAKKRHKYLLKISVLQITKCLHMDNVELSGQLEERSVKFNSAFLRHLLYRKVIPTAEDILI